MSKLVSKLFPNMVHPKAIAAMFAVALTLAIVLIVLSPPFSPDISPEQAKKLISLLFMGAAM